MANLNRIKLVLVERKKLGNGFPNSLENFHALLANGARTLYNRTSIRLTELQNC